MCSSGCEVKTCHPAPLDSDTCPICRQNISDCCCAVKNGKTLSNTCTICRQNISDCCCAVKNCQFNVDSDTCPICRQNISDCCCAVKTRFVTRYITVLLQLFNTPSYAPMDGFDTCPICGHNMSDCCCAVKNRFLSTSSLFAIAVY